MPRRTVILATAFVTILAIVAISQLGSFAQQSDGTITVRKQDVTNNGALLNDAEFALYDGSCDQLANATPVANGGTGQDGEGTLVFSGLTEGASYCIVETQPPFGYTGVSKGISAHTSTTIDVANEPSSTPPPHGEGPITVVLQDRVTGEPINGADFDLYAGTCAEVDGGNPVASGTTGDNGDGTIVFNELTATAYCVLESSPASGYAMIHGGATIYTGFTRVVLNSPLAPPPATPTA